MMRVGKLSRHHSVSRPNLATRYNHTLQHTITLQHTATHMRRACIHVLAVGSSINYHVLILQHTTTHCNTPQHTNTLQHTATHCNTLQHIGDVLASCVLAIGVNIINYHVLILQHTTTHCNTLQHTITLRHTATHCNTLQHIATHCNTLQHTATHRRRACIVRVGSWGQHHQLSRPHCHLGSHISGTWLITHDAWRMTYSHVTRLVHSCTTSALI